MFKDLFHIRPKSAFILKVGKEHRDYSLEWITDLKTSVNAVHSLVKLGNELKIINEARKPEVVQI